MIYGGFIRRFLEKLLTEAFNNVINAGLYILEPDVFDHVPLGEKFDFSKQLFPRLELDWPMYAKPSTECGSMSVNPSSYSMPNLH